MGDEEKFSVYGEEMQSTEKNPLSDSDEIRCAGSVSIFRDGAHFLMVQRKKIEREKSTTTILDDGTYGDFDPRSFVPISGINAHHIVIQHENKKGSVYFGTTKVEGTLLEENSERIVVLLDDGTTVMMYSPSRAVVPKNKPEWTVTFEGGPKVLFSMWTPSVYWKNDFQILLNFENRRGAHRLLTRAFVHSTYDSSPPLHKCNVQLVASNGKRTHERAMYREAALSSSYIQARSSPRIDRTASDLVKTYDFGHSEEIMKNAESVFVIGNAEVNVKEYYYYDLLSGSLERGFRCVVESEATPEGIVHVYKDDLYVGETRKPHAEKGESFDLFLQNPVGVFVESTYESKDDPKEPMLFKFELRAKKTEENDVPLLIVIEKDLKNWKTPDENFIYRKGHTEYELALPFGEEITLNAHFISQ